MVGKPPRVVVHRNEHTPGEYAMLQRVRDVVGSRVYPIHRLDRAASGCLLFATERERAGALHAALCAPSARKVYLALVRGWFRPDERVIVTTPMKDDNGLLKDAESEVSFLGRSHEPRCSLLRVEPRTGRYHQVRRHVRDLGHPVLGDAAHGDSRVNRWWRETWGLRRLGLHALSLSLDLPSGERIEATCPLFEDLAVLLRALPWWEEARRAEPALDLAPLPLAPEDGAPAFCHPPAPQ